LFADRGYDATSLQTSPTSWPDQGRVVLPFPSKLELLQSICEPVYEGVSAIIAAPRAKLPAAAHRRAGEGFADLTVSRRSTISRAGRGSVMAPPDEGRADGRPARPAVPRASTATPDPRPVLAVRAIAPLSDAISALPELDDDEDP